MKMKIWSINNDRRLGRVAMALAAAAGFVLAPGEAPAGQLAPPAGPVGATMKDLDTVEPRIPLTPEFVSGSATSTFFINQSGSYYLTGDLAGESGKNGIGIFASHVTIDLNGFALVGANDSLDGIIALDSTSTLHVLNGALHNWRDGLASGAASEVRIEGVIVTRSRNFGFNLSEGDIVRDCRAQSCGNDGFFTSQRCLLERCVAEDCGTQQSPAHGFYLRTGTRARDCQSIDNWGSGFFSESDCTIESCTATLNSEHGCAVGERCTVSMSTMTANARSGLFATSDAVITYCMCSSNGEQGILTQFGRATVDSCVTSGNSLDGLFVGADSRVTGCVSTFNGFHGIWANGKGVVTECIASGNFRNGFVGGTNTTSPAGAGCIFSNCIAENNGINGFITAGGSSVQSCSAIGNTNDGFRSTLESRFIDCASLSNGDQGFDTSGSILEGCASSFNASHGFSVSSSSRLVRCVSRADEIVGFLAVQDCSFEACKATATRNSAATAGAGDGFLAQFDCTYVNCEATGCAGAGFEGLGQITYLNCRATEDRNNGFELGVASSANGTFILTDCVANMNTGDGILIDAPASTSGGSILRSCIGSENSGSGIVVGQGTSLSGCSAGANQVHGIVTTGEGCRIAGCSVERNMDRGMNVVWRTKIDDCVVRFNLNYGIYAQDQCHITNNMVTGNGDGVGTDAGIRVYEGCRIEGNAISQNGGTGVRLDDNRNVVVRNTFMKNGGSQLTDVGMNNQNAPAPVTLVGAGPWANISH